MPLGRDDQVQGDVAHDAVDSGNPIKGGGRAHSSTPTPVSNGDRVNAYFDTEGFQHVKVDNTVAVSGTVAISGAVTVAEPVTVDGTVTVDSITNPVTVTGTVSVNEPVTVDGTVAVSNTGREAEGKEAHGAVNTQDPLIMGGQAANAEPAAVDNADVVRAYFDTNGYQHVKVDNTVAVSGTVAVSSVGGTVTVTGTVSVTEPVTVDGTVAVSSVGGTVTVAGAVTATCAGDVANDGVDSGKPVKFGGRASTATPIAVGVGDRVNAWFDLNGRQRTVAEGAIAHDSANTQNPLIGGGQASTAEPTAVQNADAVRAYFDENGYQRVKVQGNVAHDAADAGGPLKIGAKASTAEPTAVANNDRVDAYYDENGYARNKVQGNVAHDATDSGGPVKVGGIGDDALPSAVSANGDRVNAAFDRNGRQRVKNYRQEAEADISAIDATYDDSPTSNNSADVTITGYRTATLMFTLAESGAATYVQFKIQAKDGSNYFDLDNGFLQMLRFSVANIGGGISRAVKIPLPDCDTIRVRVETSGTTASDTITVSNSALYLGT